MVRPRTREELPFPTYPLTKRQSVKSYGQPHRGGSWRSIREQRVAEDEHTLLLRDDLGRAAPRRGPGVAACRAPDVVDVQRRNLREGQDHHPTVAVVCQVIMTTTWPATCTNSASVNGMDQRGAAAPTRAVRNPLTPVAGHVVGERSAPRKEVINDPESNRPSHRTKPEGRPVVLPRHVSPRAIPAVEAGRGAGPRRLPAFPPVASGPTQGARSGRFQLSAARLSRRDGTAGWASHNAPASRPGPCQACAFRAPFVQATSSGNEWHGNGTRRSTLAGTAIYAVTMLGKRAPRLLSPARLPVSPLRRGPRSRGHRSAGTCSQSYGPLVGAFSP